MSEKDILKDRLNKAVKLLKKTVHTYDCTFEEILDFLETALGFRRYFLKNSGDLYSYNNGVITISVKHKPYTDSRDIEITKVDLEVMLKAFEFIPEETLFDKEAVFIVPYGERLTFDKDMMLKLYQYFIDENNTEFDLE